MYKGVEMISKMLELAYTDAAVFPPTILYNKGWMLRILLSLQSEGKRGKLNVRMSFTFSLHHLYSSACGSQLSNVNVRTVMGSSP